MRITMRDLPGRPYDQLWVMELSTGKASVSEAIGRRSPYGRATANGSRFHGEDGDKYGLFIAHPDGSDTTFLTTLAGTNCPLPGTGKALPGRRIPSRSHSLFYSRCRSRRKQPAIRWSLPAISISPTAAEGMTHFNDNQRLHIFVIDVASRQVRQLTQGTTTSTPSTGRPMGGNSSSSPIANRIRTSFSTTIFSR